MKSLFNIFPELASLKGQICWSASNGYGSFITLYFGEPSLRIREPIPVIHSTSPKIKKQLSRKRVYLEGQWHIWIYMCSWKLKDKHEVFCTSDSKSKLMNNSLNLIEGQILCDILINEADGSTKFEFDYGSEILTKPYGEGDTEEDNWLIYDRSTELKVFSYNGKEFSIE